MIIEIVPIAPGAFCAALFKNIGLPNKPTLQFLRQATGRTERAAIAGLRLFECATVVSHTGTNDVVWECLS